MFTVLLCPKRIYRIKMSFQYFSEDEEHTYSISFGEKYLKPYFKLWLPVQPGLVSGRELQIMLTGVEIHRAELNSPMPVFPFSHIHLILIYVLTIPKHQQFFPGRTLAHRGMFYKCFSLSLACFSTFSPPPPRYSSLETQLLSLLES